MAIDSKELRSRHFNLSDEELSAMLITPAGVYRDDVLKMAERIRQSRFIPLDCPDQFKVITISGIEDGPFDISTIRELYSDGLIDKGTLIYCSDNDQWLPVSSVFPIDIPESLNTNSAAPEAYYPLPGSEMTSAEEDAVEAAYRPRAPMAEGTLVQGADYLPDSAEFEIDKEIGSRANTAIWIAIIGIVCMGFMEIFALIYASQAQKSIDEHGIGHEHETKIIAARIIAVSAGVF